MGPQVLVMAWHCVAHACGQVPAVKCPCPCRSHAACCLGCQGCQNSGVDYWQNRDGRRLPLGGREGGAGDEAFAAAALAVLEQAFPAYSGAALRDVLVGTCAGDLGRALDALARLEAEAAPAQPPPPPPPRAAAIAAAARAGGKPHRADKVLLALINNLAQQLLLLLCDPRRHALEPRTSDAAGCGSNWCMRHQCD